MLSSLQPVKPHFHQQQHVIFLIATIHLAVTMQTGCDNRTVTEVNCGPSYCYHGDCYIEGPVASCKCHEGWLRPLCEHCCGLPCVFGKCIGFVQGALINETHCMCDEAHEGDLCDVEVCVKQCVNGACELGNVEGNQRCVCKDGFIGELCEEADPNALPWWYWPTVGTVVAVGVVLLVVATVMPYIMWRNRALIVLRIHYFFRRYKEDYTLRYDAFIACASESNEDLDLLRETLAPMLEDMMGFRVCYEARNGNPTESPIDNTCMAVKQSRRTLLLLTPAFLADAWPIFEVQIAQHESLRSAHRIIPIVYRDLGEITHPTLRNILSSLQCLKWPEDGSARQVDKFWRKLKVLMPKQLVPVDTGHYNQFELLS